VRALNSLSINRTGRSAPAPEALKEALALSDEASALAEEIGDQFSIAMTTVQRGRILEDLGQFEESLPCFERAIAVFEDLGARWEHAGSDRSACFLRSRGQDRVPCGPLWEGRHLRHGRGRQGARRGDERVGDDRAAVLVARRLPTRGRVLHLRSGTAAPDRWSWERTPRPRARGLGSEPTRVGARRISDRVRVEGGWLALHRGGDGHRRRLAATARRAPAAGGRHCWRCTAASSERSP